MQIPIRTMEFLNHPVQEGFQTKTAPDLANKILFYFFSDRGHSLHLITTDINSEYKGDTYLVLFGGRDNDQKTQHIPKTYDVKEVKYFRNIPNSPLILR